MVEKMMFKKGSDIIEVEILEDGTVKMSTNKVSMPNHSNAEAFLRETSILLGGTVTQKRKTGTLNYHTHDGEHYHTH